MGIRLLHAADMHLGRTFSHFSGVAEQRRKDLLDAFNRICDVALERQVAAVLIAGDLFDQKSPGQDLVGKVQGQIDRLAGAGIRVFIIPGNHDDVWYEHSVWRGSDFGAAHVFTSATFEALETFEVDGIAVHIHGVAFNHVVCPAPLQTLHHSNDGVHIAMLHATVNPPAHFPALQQFFPLQGDELAQAGLDYVALGHIHRQQEIKAGGRSIGWYPGSPEGLDMTETGPRHVALVEFNGAAPNVEMIPVNTREVRSERVDVSDLAEADIVTTLRNRRQPDDLVSIEFTGSPNDVISCEAIRERLEGDFFWLELNDATEMLHSAVIERWLGRPNTIGGRFVRTISERIEAETDDEQRTVLQMALKIGVLALEKRSA